MPTITIDHGGGDTETIDQTVAWRFERQLGKMSKLVITVDRGDARAVTLDRKSDLVDLAGVYEGRLVDVNAGGSTYELVVYSREWDGKTVEPTGGGVQTTKTDDAHVTEYVNDVSSWSAGTINEVAGSITLIANHAQPHERLRKLEQKTSGEVLFDDAGNVDYVDKLGSDKTGSVTLSPQNANLDGDIKVQNRGRRIDATHVKVIGAHEGEAQFFANLVPQSDGRSYDNRVDYTTSRWSDSSDDDWARWADKSAASQNVVDAIAASLADDLTAEHIEAKATVVGEDLALGDEVHVEKPSVGIDRDMRIHRIVTRTVEDTPAATVDEVLLSTRSEARFDESKRVRDIERFNTVFQGSAVVESASGGVQAVNSSLNYQLPVFYPDVEYEHVVELYVKSIPYRAFSSGGAVGGVQNSIDPSPDSNSNTGLSLSADTETTVHSVTPVDTTTAWMGYLEVLNESAGSRTLIFNMNPEPDFNWFPVVGSLDAGEYAVFAGAGYGDANTIEFTVESLADSATIDTESYITAAGEHTHAPDPGVTEFPGETASGSDVLVNTTQEATDIGSGSFETVVNLDDTLTRDAWNTIEVTSDSLGLLLCTVAIRAYEQVGTT